MADKKKKSSSKKSSKKTVSAPDMETNVDDPKVDDPKVEEPKANETPKKSKGDKPRVWYAQPKEAASLRTHRGVLVKGKLTPVVEGSSDHEYYSKRPDVLLTTKEN